jgi:hypothetical protein
MIHILRLRRRHDMDVWNRHRGCSLGTATYPVGSHSSTVYTTVFRVNFLVLLLMRSMSESVVPKLERNDLDSQAKLSCAPSFTQYHVVVVSLMVSWPISTFFAIFIPHHQHMPLYDMCYGSPPRGDLPYWNR